MIVSGGSIHFGSPCWPAYSTNDPHARLTDLLARFAENPYARLFISTACRSLGRSKADSLHATLTGTGLPSIATTVISWPGKRKPVRYVALALSDAKHDALAFCFTGSGPVAQHPMPLMVAYS